MPKKHPLLTARTLQVISLGTLCAVGAFAMGIETAGDVHPFGTSQAALQEMTQAGTIPGGDIDGNGIVDAVDAYLLHQITSGQATPTADQLLTGDSDGDGALTEQDLAIVLQHLSLR